MSPQRKRNHDRKRGREEQQKKEAVEKQQKKELAERRKENKAKVAKANAAKKVGKVNKRKGGGGKKGGSKKTAGSTPPVARNLGSQLDQVADMGVTMAAEEFATQVVDQFVVVDGQGTPPRQTAPQSGKQAKQPLPHQK